MTAAQLAYYRRRLLSLKKRLGAELTEIEEEALRGAGGEAAGGLSDVPVHPADLGTDNYEEEVAVGLLENENELLLEIDEALYRIKEGTFGICEECGREIEKERLAVVPYASTCVQCAKALQDKAGK